MGITATVRLCVGLSNACLPTSAGHLPLARSGQGEQTYTSTDRHALMREGL
ncbi:MAG: hypothetical protein ACYCY1_06980 [Sulfuriferula sp.]